LADRFPCDEVVDTAYLPPCNHADGIHYAHGAMPGADDDREMRQVTRCSTH
jgi:hypothetical protein